MGIRVEISGHVGRSYHEALYIKSISPTRSFVYYTHILQKRVEKGLFLYILREELSMAVKSIQGVYRRILRLLNLYSYR